MDGQLLCKVLKRIKGAAGVKPLLVLTMAALHLAVVTRCVGADQLVPDAQLGGGFLKQRRQIAPAV